MVAVKVFLALYGAACVAAADFEIDYGFQYARGSSLTVKVGDTVTWAWQGKGVHNVHWYDESFNGRNFCDDPPCSVTFCAEDVGKWTYYCSVPGHKEAGQDEYSVVVEPPAGQVYEIDYGFQYARGSSVTVEVGDVVTWNWNSRIRHNVHWYDDAFNAKNFCDSPPCCKTFGEEDVGKWMYYCSVPGHRMAGQDEYSVVVKSKQPDDVVCAQDTLRCACGTTLTRDPALGCEFPECPPFEGCIMDWKTCPNGDDVFREMELDCEFAPCPGEEPQEASCDGLKAFPCNKLDNCVFAFPVGERSGQKLCRERTECDTRPDVDAGALRQELKEVWLQGKKDAVDAWKKDKKNKQLRQAKIAAVRSFKENRSRIQDELKVFKKWQKKCKRKSG